jgi:RNA polymerase sigma-70 factor (ECF subfamily)
MNDFRKIWLPLADRFYRVAYHLLESRPDAEDAVQELYLKILSMHGKLVYVRDPAAYGITLLKNICIDRIRRRESRRAEQLEEFIAADTSGPEKQMAEKDTLSRVMKEMERLPEKQAKVLRMRAVEGLEYDEIARRTGLSQVNIRVLISIARKTLKKRTGK